MVSSNENQQQDRSAHDSVIKLGYQIPNFSSDRPPALPRRASRRLQNPGVS
ncbi:hypothetical protein BC793_107119 [Actinoplanes xinjiangensis]|uniref:Uncharacterized protein n=1 Tax=Actinoplanes xinjiangensis TaxID=512350 RepID=A0A316FGE0_9ACTN|nr:hypothetical protein BC793_107119 [Actinoplanes xinjiangensis]